jgi:hypothetical protein
MSQYAIHWTAGDEEDVTIVTGCDLADDAQYTFHEKYPERNIRHTFMVSETIEAISHCDQSNKDICECGGKKTYFMANSPTGGEKEYYGCVDCFVDHFESWDRS